MKEKFEKIKEKSFIVGGAVRDKLLGLTPKDFDYVVVNSSIEEMLSFGFQKVGRDFPVFLDPVSKDEYALARTEKKDGVGYSGFSIVDLKNVSLEDDLKRRDLTINSMAIDHSGIVVDPFNGISDLKNKIIRHTSDAFSDDPLRVLRVARFLARLGSDWKVHEDTLSLIDKISKSGELNHLTPERVWKETEKALGEPFPDLYFKFLIGTGIFPELEAMLNLKQDPIHHPEGDVFIHTMLCLRRSADLGFDNETRFAVLCHDFGKPVSFSQQGNFHNHEKNGISVINSFCNRFKIPKKYRELAVISSECHTLCHSIFNLSPSKVFKLFIVKLSAHKNYSRFEKFINVCICDSQGRGPTKVDIPYIQAIEAKRILNSITSLDTKEITRNAILKGKKGSKISNAVIVAYHSAIRKSLKERKI